MLDKGESHLCQENHKTCTKAVIKCMTVGLSLYTVTPSTARTTDLEVHNL